MRLLQFLFSFLLIAAPVVSPALETRQGDVVVTRVAAGLNEPWGVAILPDGGFLVTERRGVLWHFAGGEAIRVDGVPAVAARGQGGLLDITAARDFASSREVFLTYALGQPDGASTAMAIARLSPDGRALTDLRQLFVARPASTSGRHFGSRVVEANDGRLLVTLGDRGSSDTAQDRTSHNGAVVRLSRDGSIPPDNPFVGQPGILPEIWSWGHRNAQGAGLDLDGNLLTAEHGARGGDEVNRVRKGANYGWPVITYGVDYSGAKIGEGTRKEGMEQPEFYWDPSIAPSGLMVYSGRLWPEWRGNVFVGSLKFGHISRLDGDPLREVERIEGTETQRVRDVVEAPDGAIWFISVGQGAVYRMTPGG